MSDATPAGGHLDRQLFAGIAWTALLRWIAQAISWFCTFYAAHRLTPGDYGVVAMAAVPIGLFRTVEDFGLDIVLVQDRNLSREQLSRLAGLAIGLGLTLCLVFLAAARPIAAFNHEPAVAGLVAALSVTFLLDSLQVLPRATLQRELRFRTLAVVLATQFIVTSAALVTCATLGLGHWSLVLNSLVGGITVTLILIRLAPYPVAWPREISSLARPILSGWRILVSRAGWYGYSNADQLLIGRVLGKEPLGAYSFAMTFAALPTQEVTSVVGRVVPGVFSEVQSVRAELRRYFLLLTEAMTYLAFPAAIGLALTADSVVAIALGAKYGAVVAPLRVLCIYYAFYSAQVLVSHVLMWTGNFRAHMWFTALALVGLVAGFAVSVHWGIVAVAWSWVVVFPLVNLPPLALAVRLLELPPRRFLGALVPATLGCLVMAAIVTLVQGSLSADLGAVPKLVVEVLVGATAYVAFVAVVYHRRVTEILRTVFARQRTGAVRDSPLR